MTFLLQLSGQLRLQAKHHQAGFTYFFLSNGNYCRDVLLSRWDISSDPQIQEELFLEPFAPPYCWDNGFTNLLAYGGLGFGVPVFALSSTDVQLGTCPFVALSSAFFMGGRLRSHLLRSSSHMRQFIQNKKTGKNGFCVFPCREPLQAGPAMFTTPSLLSAPCTQQRGGGSPGGKAN